MSGFDDPRYLQDVITKLQKDVEQLKKSTIPVIAQQRGPTPGWINAGQFGPGPGMKSAMHMHNDGNQPGIAPRLSVTDASGVVRVELGNLAANGISPPQYGFRANDAGGASLFDSLGLISVMSRLSKVDMTGGNQNFTTTTPTQITSVTSTFSLSRQQRVIALAYVNGFSAQQTGIVDLYLDGVDQGNPASNSAFCEMLWGFGGPTVSSATAFDGTLSAGSHTIKLMAYLSNTPGTLTVQAASLLIYQGGS